jgi:hypothetical protein
VVLQLIATASTCWYKVKTTCSPCSFGVLNTSLGPSFLNRAAARYRLILMLHGVTCLYCKTWIKMRAGTFRSEKHHKCTVYAPATLPLPWQQQRHRFVNQQCSRPSLIELDYWLFYWKYEISMWDSHCWWYPIPNTPNTTIATMLICLDVIVVHVLRLVLPHWVSTWSGP